MILTVRPATPDDALVVGHMLRAEDSLECEAVSGTTNAPRVVLDSFYNSKRCYAIRRTTPTGGIELYPCVLFGVCDDPRTEGVGVMWMLCTDSIKKCPLSILREMRFWVEGCMSLYPNGIHNIADKRNTTHLRWLQILGFALGSEVEINGQAFVHAIRRSNNVY